MNGHDHLHNGSQINWFDSTVMYNV